MVGWRATIVAAVAVAVALAGCSSGPATSADTTAQTTAAQTSSPTSTSQPASSTTTAPTTTVALPTTTISPTTTTTTTSSTSSTTTTAAAPVPTTTEPARSRSPSVLRRPNGYARHEPLPAWEGDAPLTGLAVDPAVWSRPALAVKIDNSPGGRPQWNLADADLVIEENVEGVTRFVAVYQSTVPDRVGPVRSARTSDLDILAALNRPILAWSGGNPGVTDFVRAGHRQGWMSNLSAQSTDCFWRSRTRSAPHNLVLDPTCAWASTTYAGPARPLFGRDAGGVPAGDGEDQFRVRMQGVSISWSWDAASGRYLRRQAGGWHTDVDGEVVGAENVVELFVDYRDSAIDERSPEAVTVGSGRAVVHRGGVAVRGIWTRNDRFETFTLTSPDGSPITLAPGKVFVELEG